MPVSTSEHRFGMAKISLPPVDLLWFWSGKNPLYVLPDPLTFLTTAALIASLMWWGARMPRMIT